MLQTTAAPFLRFGAINPVLVSATILYDMENKKVFFFFSLKLLLFLVFVTHRHHSLHTTTCFFYHPQQTTVGYSFCYESLIFPFCIHQAFLFPVQNEIIMTFVCWLWILFITFLVGTNLDGESAQLMIMVTWQWQLMVVTMNMNALEIYIDRLSLSFRKKLRSLLLVFRTDKNELLFMHYI